MLRVLAKCVNIAKGKGVARVDPNHNENEWITHNTVSGIFYFSHFFYYCSFNPSQVSH